MSRTDLTAAVFLARQDLMPHVGEFDSIVVAGDHHGIALGAAIAAELGKPLMIVSMSGHDDCVSHITPIGDIDPDDRFLYVDDYFKFGISRKVAFDYFNASDRAPIVATYAVTKRDYRETVNGNFVP